MTSRLLIVPLSFAFLVACSSSDVAEGEEPASAEVSEMETGSGSREEEPQGEAAGDGDTQAQKYMEWPDKDMTCPADDYQEFVGEPVSAITYPEDLRVRVIRPNDAVSMDYVPLRMNIALDENDVIKRIYCG